MAYFSIEGNPLVLGLHEKCNIDAYRWFFSLQVYVDKYGDSCDDSSISDNSVDVVFIFGHDAEMFLDEESNVGLPCSCIIHRLLDKEDVSLRYFIPEFSDGKDEIGKDDLCIQKWCLHDVLRICNFKHIYLYFKVLFMSFFSIILFVLLFLFKINCSKDCLSS